VQIKENLKEAIQFMPNPTFDNDLFGNLIANSCGLGPFKIPSKILTEVESMKLIKLCQFPENGKWTLLYRGSRDGFGATEFHSKCEGHSNTLTIIKGKQIINNEPYQYVDEVDIESADELIFGGFASIAWDSSRTAKTDSNSFIFSFKNNENKPFIRRINPSYVNSALAMYPQFGPVFGNINSGMYAIFVSDNSNRNNLNKINFESYVYSNANANRMINYGHQNPHYYGNQNHNQEKAFAIVEIEIYQQDPLKAGLVLKPVEIAKANKIVRGQF